MRHDDDDDDSKTAAQSWQEYRHYVLEELKRMNGEIAMMKKQMWTVLIAICSWLLLHFLQYIEAAAKGAGH